MKVIVEKGAFKPVRAHDIDAGLDLRAKYGRTVPAHGFATIGTGVHIELPKGCAGLLVSKSGLNTKHSITSTGLIDEGYQGEIMVKLYNDSALDYRVYEGDAISQLVVIPVRYEPIEIVDSFDKQTDRGNNGFGSTGR